MAEFKPVTLEKWGGLNLRDDEAEVGLNGAIDLLNVDFDQRGRVRTRDGYARFNTSAMSTGPGRIVSYLRDSTAALICLDVATLYAFDVSGGTIASLATGAINPTLHSGVAYGAPTTTNCYLGINRTTIRSFDGSAFATPTATVDGVAGRAMPKARWLGVTPWDNRLVAANTVGSGGPHGAASGPSTVWFSGDSPTIDAETWNTTNYVEVTPGDGEQITAVASWRDLLFVFKESRYFVFFGTSTDSTGQPVFDYRKVDVGIGAQSGAVAVTPRGVYFAAHDGVYFTTGGIPAKVSTGLDPLFRAQSTPFFSGDSPLTTNHGLACAAGRVFYSPAPGSTYVYDEQADAWFYWEIDAASVNMVSHKAGTGVPERLFFAEESAGYIGQVTPNATADNGTAITSRYRTGFFSPAGATVPSTIREVLLEGTGVVDVQSSDNYGDLDTFSTVTLGTSPAIAQGRDGKANNGRYHSYQFSSETGPWTLNRATFMIESKGPVGKQP